MNCVIGYKCPLCQNTFCWEDHKGKHWIGQCVDKSSSSQTKELEVVNISGKDTIEQEEFSPNTLSMFANAIDRQEERNRIRDQEHWHEVQCHSIASNTENELADTTSLD